MQRWLIVFMWQPCDELATNLAGIMVPLTQCQLRLVRATCDPEKDKQL